MPDTSIGGKIDALALQDVTVQGTLADAAADTASVATMVSLLRQIAEAVNNGSGAALTTNKSIVDLIGVGTGATSLVDQLLSRDIPRKVLKSVTFETGVGKGDIGTVALFTVTGAVRLKLYAICTLTIVGAGTLECGMAGATAAVIAQIPNATSLATGKLWVDATPTNKIEPDSVIPDVVIGDGADLILTIGAANLTAGTIVFVAEWNPLTTDGALVAA